jgi:ribosomal protein L37AE/L43A
MNAHASSTAIQNNHTEMETAKESAAPENQVSKYVCPQCSAEIHWHLDGKYWHGECSGCSMELSGKIHDAVHPSVLPEDHVCLNIRGC